MIHVIVWVFLIVTMKTNLHVQGMLVMRKIYHLIILHLQIWVIEHEFLKVVATGVQQTSNSEGTVGTKKIIN